MGNEWESVAHPKSQREAFTETAHLENQADNAFKAPSAGDKASFISNIRQELEAMTPVERMTVAHILNTTAKSLADIGDQTTPAKGVSAVPMAKMELDPSGDIKSLTFKSISSDKHFGETIDIDLSKKRTDNGPNTKELKLPDGETRVVQMDPAGKPPPAVQDSSGTSFQRAEDGNSWVRNGSDGSVETVKDLKVNDDGSVSYKMTDDKLPDAMRSAELTERMKANGDLSLTAKAAVIDQDGKAHDFELITHRETPDDGKTSSIVRTTARVADLGHEESTTETRMLNGDTITETPGSKVAVSAYGNKYTFNNLDANGQAEPGVVTASRVLDPEGKFASGTLEVTFPDGKSKKFDDLQAQEWDKMTSGSGQRIKWITKDGDPDYFTITTQPENN